MHEQSTRRTFTVRDSDGYRADFTEDEGGLSVTVDVSVAVDIEPDDRLALAAFLCPPDPQPATRPKGGPNYFEHTDSDGDEVSVEPLGNGGGVMVRTKASRGSERATAVIVRDADVRRLLQCLADAGYTL